MNANWLAVRACSVSAACVVLMVLAPVSARAAEHCARVSDPNVRLACYDAAYPVQGATEADQSGGQPAMSGIPVLAPTATSGAVNSSQPRSTLQDRVTAGTTPDATDAQSIAATEHRPNAIAPAPAVSRSTSTQAASDRFGLPLASPLAAADDVDLLESTVVAVRKQARQNTVYRLANGQIWMQTAPREVTIDEGDHVTIRRGMLGGYMLRNHDGASTRVGRIR